MTAEALRDVYGAMETKDDADDAWSGNWSASLRRCRGGERRKNGEGRPLRGHTRLGSGASLPIASRSRGFATRENLRLLPPF